ncbi:DUF4124 domain-containing protein [Tahibacter soli]|uniref:DUF4124 domain-containing protein n=1 Tax=Tahibacter soli TaxID=2983605 RepID=A0A9X4BH43_9GAMM|nr:DUF4124 domain-containing protein [Tahibacter soli]MDC8013665.1 DUF4124 domain-containing protein [Tahibacter soli]
MRRHVRPGLLALLLVAAGAAHAETGYRCVDATGRVAFQDRPCPAGSAASSFRYEKPPPGPPPAPAAVETKPEAPPAPAAPPPQRVPVAPLYACTNAVNGDGYMSETGVTQPYLAPLGALGWPPRTLNDTARSSGLSAPGMNRPSVSAPTGSNALAGAYVTVQDECRRLSDAAACAMRRKEIGDNRSRQRNAFKAERATLEAREAALEQALAGCR